MDVDIVNRNVASEHEIAVPAVAAFDVLPAAYAQLGIPTIAVVDTRGGVYTVGIRNMQVHGSLGGTRLSQYIDCGSGAMRTPADTYQINFSATTYVEPQESGSVLHTLIMADARDPGDNRPPVRCASTGRFENRLAELVASK